MVVVVLIKVGLVVGTVWLTNDLGVWDGPDTTSSIYTDIKIKLKPYAEDLQQKFCSKYGGIDKENIKTWRESCVEAWNDTVKEGFLTVKKLPLYCDRFTDDVQRTINRILNSG